MGSREILWQISMKSIHKKIGVCYINKQWWDTYKVWELSDVTDYKFWGKEIKPQQTTYSFVQSILLLSKYRLHPGFYGDVYIGGRKIYLQPQEPHLQMCLKRYLVFVASKVMLSRVGLI